MTSAPASRPSTIPLPRLSHEGIYQAILNGVTKGTTRTGKDCLRLSFKVPNLDGLAYRGGTAVTVRTLSLPDPDQSGFSEAYEEASAILGAFNLPIESEAMNRLFDSADAPIADQKNAWRQVFVACLGRQVTIEVERYDIAGDSGETITGFSVNKIRKAKLAENAVSPRRIEGAVSPDRRSDTETAVTSHGTTVEVAAGTRDQSIVDSVAS